MARKAFGRAGADITPDRGPSLSLRVLTGLSVGCFFRQGYDRPRILPESASGGVCTSTGPIGQGDASIDQIARVVAFGEPGIERGEGAGGVALARALPEPREAGGGALLGRLGLLPPGDLQDLAEERLCLFALRAVGTPLWIFCLAYERQSNYAAARGGGGDVRAGNRVFTVCSDPSSWCRFWCR